LNIFIHTAVNDVTRETRVQARTYQSILLIISRPRSKVTAMRIETNCFKETIRVK